MGSFMQTMLVATLLVAPVRALGAEPDANPSGHWEGTLAVPSAAVTIEVDLAKSTKGQLVGTFGNRGEGESGLPLASIAVSGKAVTFAINATSGGGTFHGVLGADGKTMSGDFVTTDGKYKIPFDLKRTGDARIAPPPKSPAISKRLEGRWTGALTVDDKQVPIVLTMANQPDGTATGTIASGGVVLPIAMKQEAANLHIEVPSVRASYAGVLNGAGTELAGTWTQRKLTLPLTLQRAK